MDGLIDFIFVRSLFLGIQPSKETYLKIVPVAQTGIHSH